MKVIFVSNGYYTRIKRAIKELEDANNYTGGNGVNKNIRDEVKEQLKTKKNERKTEFKRIS